jgi:hypothetical protein
MKYVLETMPDMIGIVCELQGIVSVLIGMGSISNQFLLVSLLILGIVLSIGNLWKGNHLRLECGMNCKSI